VIAALSAWHEQHDAASTALRTVRALPAHVLIEAYSMLTRRPSGLAVAPALAAEVLAGRFGERTLGLPDDERDRLISALADAGVLGGASYDGLVALEARAHGATLLTLDERARSTYRRLGADCSVIA
jgi:predicted nucleic acid-binding protein